MAPTRISIPAPIRPLFFPEWCSRLLTTDGLPVGTTTYLYSWGIGKWFRPWKQSLLGQDSDFLRPSYNAPPAGGRTLLGIDTVAYDTSYKNVMFQDSLIFNFVPGRAGMYQFQNVNFWPLDDRGFGQEPTRSFDGTLSTPLHIITRLQCILKAILIQNGTDIRLRR